LVIYSTVTGSSTVNLSISLPPKRHKTQTKKKVRERRGEEGTSTKHKKEKEEVTRGGVGGLGGWGVGLLPMGLSFDTSPVNENPGIGIETRKSTHNMRIKHRNFPHRPRILQLERCLLLNPQDNDRGPTHTNLTPS
jgi:hypothetical protein